MPASRILAAITVIATLSLAGLAPAADSADDSAAESAAPSSWSRFHGAGGLGYVADGSIPATWTDADYAWRRPLGSRDVASPVITGGKVFLLVSEPAKKKIALQAVELTSGKLLWSKSYDQQPHHLHSRNTLASGTPVANDTHVFVAWADDAHTWLKCLDHEGNEVWSRDFGSWQSQHGFGTSPALIGSLVVMLNSQQADQLEPGQSPGESRLIAVDQTSGETVWQTPLKATRSCYGVPAVYRDGDITQIIAANAGNGMFSVDAATGKMIWQTPVFPSRSCSTPVIVGDLVVGTSGSGGGGNNKLIAVRIPKLVDGKPAVEPEEAFRIERNAPYVPTPAVKDGRLFTVDDRGIASCIDGGSGAVLWKKRIGGNYGASPVIIGDKVLVISLDGKATVLAASDQFEKLGEVDLGGPVGATPAFADGKLLLRIDEELVCLGRPAI